MPLFSAGLIRIESGALYSSSMQVVPRATNVKVGYSIPRANIMTLGRSKPLANRPVINYTVPELSLDWYKSDNQIEQCLNLVNPTGLCAGIIDTKPASATYGIRSFQILFAPTSAANYNGQFDFKSGVLASYSLQGSVGEPVRATATFQGLDMSGSINTSPRDTTNFATNLVKPEGINLTGIQFTGYGLTGITIQSFSFSAGFTRQAVQQLGQKFPVERPLTDASCSLQLQGWFDGVNNSLTGLNQYDCGQPTAGVVGLTMVPSCVSTNSASTITITNPYFDGMNVEAQAGGFTTFTMSLSMPIGVNPFETTDGSVVSLT